MASYARLLNVSRGSLSYPGMLEVGELVKLKSGGPVMVVEGSGNEGVVCVWQGKDGSTRREGFRAELLRRHERIWKR